MKSSVFSLSAHRGRGTNCRTRQTLPPAGSKNPAKPGGRDGTKLAAKITGNPCAERAP